VLYQHIFAPEVGIRGNYKHKYTLEEKDSYRWIIGLQQTDKVYKDEPIEVIMISDREGDFYEHLNYERSANVELLVRAGQPRRNVEVNNQRVKITDLYKHFPIAGYTQVAISRQKNRRTRTANLEVRYGQFTYPVPTHKKGEPLQLNFVHVKETGKTKEPIEWCLLTTLTVESLEQALELVEYYTKRWIIERFHYVQKTGLNIEKLQINTFERLCNALRIYAIVAWRILHLAYLGKIKPNESAAHFFEQEYIEILQQVSTKQIKTVKDFILALGKLVGFSSSKEQPLPGEKLLWQAWGQINQILKGWKLAQCKSQHFYGTG